MTATCGVSGGHATAADSQVLWVAVGACGRQGLDPRIVDGMRYKVVLERSDEGVSVHAPGLPGCWSQGDTKAEALANIADAIREYLAAIADLTQGAEVR